MSRTGSLYSALAGARAIATTSLLVGLGTMAGCGSVESASWEEWHRPADSLATRTLVDAPDLCSDCVSLSPVTILGDTVGPGYLAEPSVVVQDSLGRFWVGDIDLLKVFDRDGTFLRDIGRAGGGPLEFRSRPVPRHVDAVGRVHVFDSSNRRISLLGPALALDSERPLPGQVLGAVPVEDGEKYVANMWLPTADRIGFPLHLIEGDQILNSFGVREDGSTGLLDRNNAERILAVGPGGLVFSAERLRYAIDVWTQDGLRVTGFDGPLLNQTEVRPTGFSPDNPLPSQIVSIRLGEDGLLWVLSWHPKEDWLDALEETVLPDGRVVWGLKDGWGSVTSMYGSRIDVIDLSNATIIARAEIDQFLTGFFGRSFIAEGEFLENGTPLIPIWTTRFNPTRR